MIDERTTTHVRCDHPICEVMGPASLDRSVGSARSLAKSAGWEIGWGPRGRRMEFCPTHRGSAHRVTF
jgi:hypothetical protein